jgi:hypothetical protein
MIHRCVWYNGHALTIYVSFMVKCVCYMGLRSNSCFKTSTVLTGGHCRTDIISGVGHPRLDLVVLLVLCTVVYNIWDTGIVLQVPWEGLGLGNGGNGDGKGFSTNHPNFWQ